MKQRKSMFGPLVICLLSCLSFVGCESTGGGGGSSTVYYGTGFYDPWYHGDIYDNDIVVAPPDADRPRPSHPIARPPASAAPRPTPMPSIPAMPRAAPRGR